MENSGKIRIYNILTVVLIVLAIITIIPVKTGKDMNILKFYSVCSFSPVSTVICLYAAYVTNSLKKKITNKDGDESA